MLVEEIAGTKSVHRPHAVLHVAMAFVNNLYRYLEDAGFELAVRMNLKEELIDVCHFHDRTDANMHLLDAIKEYFDDDYGVAGDWALTEDGIEFCNEVWYVADTLSKAAFRNVYTHPAPAQPLSVEQIEDHLSKYPKDDLPSLWPFAAGVRWAEKHHKIGGEK